MFLFPCVLSALLPCLNAKLTMMVVWGQPPIDSQHGAIVQSGVTWEQCIQMCYQLDSCILAHQPNSDTCLNFDFDKISSVTKTTSGDGFRVAFKVDSKDFGGSCPDGSNPPTFDDTEAGGQLEIPEADTGGSVTYAVKLTGDHWVIGYSKGMTAGTSTTLASNTMPSTTVSISTLKPTAMSISLATSIEPTSSTSTTPSNQTTPIVTPSELSTSPSFTTLTSTTQTSSKPTAKSTVATGSTVISSEPISKSTSFTTRTSTKTSTAKPTTQYVGKWTAWKNVPGAVCSATCGSCGKIKQRRIRQVGDNLVTETDWVPCNTKSCTYPSVSCCSPYDHIIVSGEYRCGAPKS